VLARVAGIVPLVAAAVPPVLVALTVARQGLTTPFMDEWTLAPFVTLMFEGNLHPSALWMQNNEHRPVVPRLVMLALARATRWDLRAELVANLAVALVSFALLVDLVRRTLRPFAPALVPWVILTTSLLTFSFAQWQNWTWGWQLTIFLNVAATITAARVLATWRGGWGGTMLMFASASVAALSFASGLVLVGLLPLFVLAAPDAGPARRRMLHALVLGIAAGGLLALYLTGLVRPPEQPAPMSPMTDVSRFARWVLAHIGSTFALADGRRAVRWGAVGVGLLFGGASLWLWSPRHRRALLPWLLLGAYAACNAVMIGIGRVRAGDSAALMSRYVTLSALLWTSATVMATLAVTQLGRDRRAGAVFGCLAALLAALAAPGYATSWETGVRQNAARLRSARAGAVCLARLDTAPDPCLRRICWNPGLARAWATNLRRLGLGPYRDAARADTSGPTR
jgi:hypothetical protein